MSDNTATAIQFKAKGGTRVTIAHDIDEKVRPLLAGWFGHRIVGDFFIQSIAGRTLARMKQLAEERNG